MNKSHSRSFSRIKNLPSNPKSIDEPQMPVSNINLSKFKFSLKKNSKLFKHNNNTEPFMRVITSTMLVSNDSILEEEQEQDQSSIITQSMTESHGTKMNMNVRIKNIFEKIKFAKSQRRSIPHAIKYNILRKHIFLARINKCNTKSQLVHILFDLSLIWKSLLKNYLEKVFLMHLHLRHIKDFSDLMSHRQLLYQAIDTPNILLKRFSLGNNVIKNFCKGFVSFVFMFYEELVKYNFLPTKTHNLITSREE